MWNTDLLCQKWQLRSKEIGMIICLTQPDIYFCDLDEFDDWQIVYHNTHFSGAIPTEEELTKVLLLISQFCQTNPSLIIGIMDFTIYNLPYYVAAQYLMRVKKLPLAQTSVSLELSKNIPNKTLFSFMQQSRQSSQNVHSANNETDKLIHLFHSCTHRAFCLPMKIDSPLSEIPEIDGLLCSWLPHGERVFLFIVEGRGIMIQSENNKNTIRGILPHTFVNAQNKLHHNTICDGVLVLEKKLNPPFLRLLLFDVLTINGMSLKSLPYSQRIHALRKEVIDKIRQRKEQELEKIKQSEFKSIGLRDVWPIQQLKKVKTSLLPSLTHDSDGISVFDPSAPYVYGDQESRWWKYEGDF